MPAPLSGGCREDDRLADPATPAGPTRGRVAVFVTCYGRFNQPQMVEDLVAVLRHNRIPTRLVRANHCCGMPKLELGDLESVDRYRRAHTPLARARWSRKAGTSSPRCPPAC
ncbi:MAG: heterodisulfide reductase-related iron-sulfur binding cluster [Xanthomonadales bacterium]|nr:heterodisulfide reductase-related iron-sulfur binding cluster [Xanthomonadales bacterium]